MVGRFTSVLAVFLLLIVGSVSAQTVVLKGIVTDEKSGETLIGANVVANGSLGVTTDLDGNYELKLTPDKHTIQVSFIGYKAVVSEVDLRDGNTQTMNFSLKIMSKELDFVVVSASQYEKNIAEETVSMDILDKDLVRNNNATDIGEAVKKTPGVLIQDSQISIRGGSGYSYGVGSRTAVMMDGVSFMSPDLGEAQMGGAPLENVEQIEVIKGSSSVVYGSSALNGVVNVRTAWPKSAEPKTRAIVYFGVYDDPPERDSLRTIRWWGDEEVRNKMGFNVTHSQKIKSVDLIIGANILNHRSYLQAADELRGGANFKLRVHDKKRKGMTYGVNANFSAEKSGRFFLSTNPVTAPLHSWQHSNDRYARVNVDPHFNYLDGGGNRHKIESRYMFITRIPEKTSSTEPAKSHSVTVNYQYQKRWQRFVLTTGLPLFVGFTKSNLYPGPRTVYSGAVYLQGEYKSKDKRVSAVAGARYEVLGVGDFTESSLPIFRAGLNYRTGKATFLRASAGQSYRLPTIAERFLDEQLNDQITVIPNRDLVAERGFGAEVGVKQVMKLNKWVGYVDLAFYYQQYKKFVEYRFVSVLSHPELFEGIEGNHIIGLYPTNVEDALISGLELSFASRGNIGPIGVKALIGWTYNMPMNLDSAKNIGLGGYMEMFFANMFTKVSEEQSARLLQFRSRNQVVGDLELSYKKFSLGGAIFYGSFPEYLPGTAVDAINLISGTVEGEEAMTVYAREHTKGDLIFDARIAYQVFKFMKASFIVKNLGNKLYAIRPSKAEPIRNYTLQLQFNI